VNFATCDPLGPTIKVRRSCLCTLSRPPYTAHHAPFDFLLSVPHHTMPLCPLCVTDFPALPAGTACKRCAALQALDVEPDHPNYVQIQASTTMIISGIGDTHTVFTQGWKQCLHCGISAPHLGTTPNVSKIVCLNQICVAWATASADGKFTLLVGVTEILQM